MLEVFFNTRGKHVIHSLIENWPLDKFILFYFHITHNLLLITIVSAKTLGLGVSDWYSSKGFTLQSPAPLALPHNKRVSLSFIGLYPGSVMSSDFTEIKVTVLKIQLKYLYYF